jgi:transposase-like protein
LRSEYSETELSVPRDREGEVRAAIVKKHQKEGTGIEGPSAAALIRGRYASKNSKNYQW